MMNGVHRKAIYGKVNLIAHRGIERHCAHTQTKVYTRRQQPTTRGAQIDSPLATCKNINKYRNIEIDVIFPKILIKVKIRIVLNFGIKRNFVTNYCHRELRFTIMM